MNAGAPICVEGFEMLYVTFAEMVRNHTGPACDYVKKLEHKNEYIMGYFETCFKLIRHLEAIPDVT